MKKLIFKLFAYFLILSSLCLGFGLFVIQGLPARFQRSYQSAIVDQYDRFVQTTSPKIIFLAGSSGAFGLDIDRMEQALNIPVTSLALHAGFGNRFPMELSKANIQSGDIIVLAFEYQVYNDEDRFGSELVATALDQRIDMYRALSFDDMVQIVRYFPKFLFKKVDSLMQNPDGVPAAGVYARSAFNEHGNMISVSYTHLDVYKRQHHIEFFPFNLWRTGPRGQGQIVIIILLVRIMITSEPRTLIT